ncbi:hypothetical protein [Polycladidibacter hongkongensis]|uniref:hypothetical protein n=1 Tax=Polycladidibacter hongkongensis TaxID=1647556 RepID=UPI0008299534|nr:hypothetical protein [Pseudovibrio hongkongensis]
MEKLTQSLKEHARRYSQPLKGVLYEAADAVEQLQIRKSDRERELESLLNNGNAAKDAPALLDHMADLLIKLDPIMQNHHAVTAARKISRAMRKALEVSRDG